VDVNNILKPLMPHGISGTTLSGLKRVPTSEIYMSTMFVSSMIGNLKQNITNKSKKLGSNI
jgi:hypothetical protein